MATLIKRVPTRSLELDFTSFLRADDMIEELRLDILVQAKKVSRETLAFFEQYEKYAFIWTIDRNQYMEAFLKYGRQLSIEDLKAIEDEVFTEEPKQPSHDAFENEIKRHRDLIPQIESIPEHVDIAPWFRVKTTLFKTKCIAEIIKWSEMFMDYLHNNVTTRLNKLENFVSDAKVLLSKRCETHELDKFRKMHSKMDEIERQAQEVDVMFEPLKVETLLLRKYGQEIETNVKEQFIELPLWWKKLKKQKEIVRNDIEPVKKHQMNLTGKRIKLFEIRIHDFHKRFHNQAFFHRDCQNAYEILDKMLDQILKYERTAELLDIYAGLFKINVALSNALIQEFSKEAKVLKQVWDYWYSLQFRMNLWANTLWSKIDVEAVEGECKRLSKEVRALDKCCKEWDPFVIMESELINLLTSLRVLTSIQNPSIKDRHFDELRAIVGFYFEINEKTTFNDLVKLKLHLYEEQVKELVDKAVKEQAIEKALTEVVKAWTDAAFEFEQIGNKKLLKLSDDFMDLLEDHLTQLQTMVIESFKIIRDKFNTNSFSHASNVSFRSF